MSLPRKVGLLVYQLGIFQCDIFKVAFHLCNDRGIHFARSVLSSAQGICSDWTTVISKKASFNGYPPLNGSNLIPIRSSSDGSYARINHRGQNSVFNRLGRNWIKKPHHSAKNTGPSRISNSSSPFSGINLGLNLGPSLQVSPANDYARLSHKLALDLNAAPNSQMGRISCSRCFSNKHTRASCSRPVRCGLCFRLDHVAHSCRYPPRFPGLSMDMQFTTSVPQSGWENANVHLWFQSPLSMASGPTTKRLPVVGNFQHLGRSLLGAPAVAPEITVLWQLSPSTPVSGVVAPTSKLSSPSSHLPCSSLPRESSHGDLPHPAEAHPHCCSHPICHLLFSGDPTLWQAAFPENPPLSPMAYRFVDPTSFKTFLVVVSGSWWASASQCPGLFLVVHEEIRVMWQ